MADAKTRRKETKERKRLIGVLKKEEGRLVAELEVVRGAIKELEENRLKGGM